MGLPEIPAKLNTVDFAHSHSLVKGNLKLHLAVRFQLSWEWQVCFSKYTG